MVQINTNYKEGFYEGENPYHYSLLKALKYFDITKFTDQTEFWTLGAREWHEFRWLIENGVKFGPKSYHNVDREKIDFNKDKRVVSHQNMDFFDTYKLWKHPVVINFDSTNIICEKNKHIWLMLIQLALKAMDKSPKVSLNMNWMMDYASISSHKVEDVLDLFQSWLQQLRDSVEYDGYRITFFERAIGAPKERSTTNMISCHCLVEGSK